MRPGFKRIRRDENCKLGKALISARSSMAWWVAPSGPTNSAMRQLYIKVGIGDGIADLFKGFLHRKHGKAQQPGLIRRRQPGGHPIISASLTPTLIYLSGKVCLNQLSAGIWLNPSNDDQREYSWLG